MTGPDDSGGFAVYVIYARPRFLPNHAYVAVRTVVHTHLIEGIPVTYFDVQDWAFVSEDLASARDWCHRQGAGIPMTLDDDVDAAVAEIWA